MKLVFKFQQLLTLPSHVDGPQHSGDLRGGPALPRGMELCPVTGSTEGHTHVFS